MKTKHTAFALLAAAFAIAGGLFLAACTSASVKDVGASYTHDGTTLSGSAGQIDVSK